MSKYKKSDFNRVTWEEYGKTLETLYQKTGKYLKDNNLEIDVVVPILRGGGVPGTYLAYKFGILRVLPVQYHYFFSPGKTELRKTLDLPKAILPKNPVILLVEGNHCFGLTAQTAVNDLKEKFINSKIIYVADHIDFTYKNIKGVDIIIYGKLTDETRGISKEDAKKEGVEKGVSYLLPWEEIDEEWITVSGKQFRYKDVEKIYNSSEVKQVMTTDDYFRELK